MNDPKTQAEPSMEEILASIRRIISEDGPEAQDQAARPDPGEDGAGLLPPEDQADDDDVLELTEVADEPTPSEPAPAVHETAPVPDPSAGSEEPAAPQWPKETPMPPSGRDGDRLMSPDAEAMAEDALSRLIRDEARPVPSHDPLPLGDARTVEQIVRELLKPVLRDWLDRNLPAIVERVVEEQVERMARNVQRR